MSKDIVGYETQLAESIRAFRKSRGLSQADLAQKAGLDRKTINRIENGHYSPTMSNFFNISKALDVEPQDLLTPTVCTSS
ncbi:helix-turn-helix transcriptional regulator [Aurantimicrobium sp. MWH-Uga1]|uniref:helix-turn-helix transcriptional regulator n=1 Tax=Aurantimicrobium sp. MWH-Uga1 TaxID=2079575 RepID=UPI000DEDF109|nr:helix-turn-helix transcriptional regulator [Aurantimicrobium sp. MWH-Uga1]AXE54923.1 Antitoxin HipB [Aurantimicrobium sp. MWH-Uga1]